MDKDLKRVDKLEIESEDEAYDEEEGRKTGEKEKSSN